MLHGDNTPASPSLQIIQFPLGLLRNTRGARPLTLGPCPGNVLGRHRDVTWSRRPGRKQVTLYPGPDLDQVKEAVSE